MVLLMLSVDMASTGERFKTNVAKTDPKTDCHQKQMAAGAATLIFSPLLLFSFFSLRPNHVRHWIHKQTVLSAKVKMKKQNRAFERTVLVQM